MSNEKIQLKKSTVPGLKSSQQASFLPPKAPAQNAEADSVNEASEVLEGFKARAEREDQRYQDAVDLEYWVCLCFQTREQVQEFMQKIGVQAWNDKYIDGLEVARLMGITIESPTPKNPKLKLDSKLIGMARPLSTVK